MILNEAESGCDGNAISWLPHGRAFSIRNTTFFIRQILPQYFGNCKIASFFRQLNIYGFVRITTGFNTGAYYNEYFLRGKPYLTRDISWKLRLSSQKVFIVICPGIEINCNLDKTMYIELSEKRCYFAVSKVLWQDLSDKKCCVSDGEEIALPSHPL